MNPRRNIQRKRRANKRLALYRKNVWAPLIGQRLERNIGRRYGVSATALRRSRRAIHKTSLRMAASLGNAAKAMLGLSDAFKQAKLAQDSMPLWI